MIISNRSEKRSQLLSILDLVCRPSNGLCFEKRSTKWQMWQHKAQQFECRVVYGQPLSMPGSGQPREQESLARLCATWPLERNSFTLLVPSGASTRFCGC